MKCQVDAIQWGGGDSSRNLPWSIEADAIQCGGSSINFPLSPKAEPLQHCCILKVYNKHFSSCQVNV